MTKDRDLTAAIKAAIREAPTASDAQIAGKVGAHHDLVSDIRAEMGARDTWPTKKESKP